MNNNNNNRLREPEAQQRPVLEGEVREERLALADVADVLPLGNVIKGTERTHRYVSMCQVMPYEIEAFEMNIYKLYHLYACVTNANWGAAAEIACC